MILDGFDEMAQKVNYDAVVKNFWELATLAPISTRDKLASSKVILTSRTEFFRSEIEAIKVLGGKERVNDDFGKTQFEVIHLDEFSPKEVEKLVEMRLGEDKADLYIKKIRENQYLQDVIRRPLLTDILIKTIPNLDADEPLNLAEIYRTFTTQVLQRNITTEKTFIDLSDKIFFLSELAWEMLYGAEYPRLKIYFKEIPDKINNWFPNVKSQPEIDHYAYDLQNQTLLNRTQDGNYEFAHKSYAEYFVALKLAFATGCILDKWIPELKDNSKGYLSKSEISELVEYMGTAPLSIEIFNFMKDMTSLLEIKTLFADLRGKDFSEIRYLAGNIATLLNAMGEPFENQDLSRYCLRGVRFTNISLRGTNLSNTDLRGATLDRVVIDETTKVTGADFNAIVFGQVPGAHCLAYSPTGLTVALCGYDGTTRIIDIEQATVIKEIPGHDGRVVECAFSHDGNLLATAGDDRIVRVFDFEKDENIAILKGHSDKVFCLEFLDNNTLLSGGADGKLYRWSVENARKIEELGIHNDYVCSISKSEISDYIASASGDHYIRIWKKTDFSHVLEFDTGSHVHCINFTHDGKKVITFADDSVSCFEVDTQEKVWSIPRDDFTGFHSQHFVSQKYVIYRNHVRDTNIINIADGKIVRTLVPPHPTWISSASFSPDESEVATVSADGTVYIWDVESGKKKKSILLNPKVTIDPIGREIEKITKQRTK